MADDDKPTSKDTFDRITNPDGTPVRDKDNAAPVLKPNYGQHVPNLAPAGMGGIRQRGNYQFTAQEQSKLTIDTRFETNTHRYVTGHFTDAPDVEFSARVSHEHTDKGINGSNVDQLVLKQDDQVLVRQNTIADENDIEPQTPEAKQLVQDVCDELDGTRSQEQEHNISDDQAQQQPAPREKIQFHKDDAQDQRIDFRANKSDLVPTRSEAGLSIDGGKTEPSQWISGKIITMPGYEFHAKTYDEPSEHGIEGGTISKLQLTKDGEQVAHYDRGWDQKPETAEHVEALERIRNGLGDEPEKTITAPDRTNDKDHGLDR